MTGEQRGRVVLIQVCLSACLSGFAGWASGQDVVKSVADLHGLPARIAFGSCAHQDKPQPILRKVFEAEPDIFVYLGDNIYGDTRDMAVLRAKYAKLAAKPEFQALRERTAVLATWDDHDYGANDAGKEYAEKEASRAIFLDFWKEPADSPRRKHPGIYHAHRFAQDGRTLQIILLDTRTFRDPLRRNSNRRPLVASPPDLDQGPFKPDDGPFKPDDGPFKPDDGPFKPDDGPFKNDYRPDPDPNKTLLGVEQWSWLEQQLREPADLRIIGSSIQFAHQYNGWESWTNLPAEQQRMGELIRKTRAGGVVFISGDVHWGEISKRQIPGGYPLYDVTASGITETWPTVEPNRFRQGEVVRDNHFGVIEIDWQRQDPEVRLQIRDRQGRTRVQQTLRLSELAFP